MTSVSVPGVGEGGGETGVMLLGKYENRHRLEICEPEATVNHCLDPVAGVWPRSYDHQLYFYLEPTKTLLIH